MLKAYAVALVLTTSTPVLDNDAEGLKAAELNTQAQTQIFKNPGKPGKPDVRS